MVTIEFSEHVTHPWVREPVRTLQIRPDWKMETDVHGLTLSHQGRTVLYPWSRVARVVTESKQ